MTHRSFVRSHRPRSLLLVVLSPDARPVHMFNRQQAPRSLRTPPAQSTLLARFGQRDLSEQARSAIDDVRVPSSQLALPSLTLPAHLAAVAWLEAGWREPLLFFRDQGLTQRLASNAHVRSSLCSVINRALDPRRPPLVVLHLSSHALQPPPAPTRYGSCRRSKLRRSLSS